MSRCPFLLMILYLIFMRVRLLLLLNIDLEENGLCFIKNVQICFNIFASHCKLTKKIWVFIGMHYIVGPYLCIVMIFLVF